MIAMTHALAMSIGLDAGNKSMRKAGRSKWNYGDWNVCVAAFNKAMGIKSDTREAIGGSYART